MSQVIKGWHQNPMTSLEKTVFQNLEHFQEDLAFCPPLMRGEIFFIGCTGY